MRSDSDIKRDVELELQWDPDISSDDIGVAVKDGVVTLTGFVRSYSEKYEAERDAKRVSGVVGLANDIEVRLPSSDERPDPEIAREASGTCCTISLKLRSPRRWGMSSPALDRPSRAFGRRPAARPVSFAEGVSAERKVRFLTAPNVSSPHRRAVQRRASRSSMCFATRRRRTGVQARLIWTSLLQAEAAWTSGVTTIRARYSSSPDSLSGKSQSRLKLR